MTDIVERLRGLATHICGAFGDTSVCDEAPCACSIEAEAADEIERLRKALAAATLANDRLADEVESLGRAVGINRFHVSTLRLMGSADPAQWLDPQ